MCKNNYLLILPNELVISVQRYTSFTNTKFSLVSVSCLVIQPFIWLFPQNQDTALTIASYYGKIEVVKELLAVGAHTDLQANVCTACETWQYMKVCCLATKMVNARTWIVHVEVTYNPWTEPGNKIHYPRNWGLVCNHCYFHLIYLPLVTCVGC